MTKKHNENPAWFVRIDIIAEFEIEEENEMKMWRSGNGDIRRKGGGDKPYALYFS